ncbi:ATP-binding protein [Xylanibacter muris]|uniref:DNA polymerase III subunit delta n=1 Tax=Xylanibacter muris TaxID=2736290 RepID=A0ABX2ALB0_9BACT|nr:ATP-binding protein [Xylanibacter muris]NPD91986.1 DNA polymerase III subunit delta [Xylanibacter muris]
MKFSEVIGQEEVRKRLVGMVSGGRLPHAMMFCGPKGCGKMALALSFASYLLCAGRDESHEADSCGICRQCAMLRKWEHPDLHFTYPTIKLPSMSSDHKPVSDDFSREWREMLRSEGPYFTMDRWLREMGAENQQAIITAGESDSLTRKLSMKSSQGGYKVSLIWLPERMNAECANKLLKLIEEPPSQTVFIMVCEEPDKLLETIRSRTQRIDIHKIDNGSVEKAIMARDRNMTPEDARRIARIANGNWLKVIEETAPGNEAMEFLDLFQMLMRLAYMRNVKELKKWSDTLQSFGREKQKRFLDYFMRLIRENFMYNFREPSLVYMTSREEEFARNFSRFVNEYNIFPICDLAGRAARDIGQNANARMVFFDFAMQMIVLLIQKKENS